MNAATLREAFANRIGGPSPTVRIEAPGRVNLMGDHIDYLGLGVLPMALDRRVQILARARSDAMVELQNIDARFPSRSFQATPVIERSGAGDWSDYVRAAVHGLYHQVPAPARGFAALVATDLPLAAGLSSSSALVVAAALAWLHANATSIERVRLAAILAAAERYVGTQGGGMDQAACLLAREGHALHIEFEPLRATAIAIPPDWRFVIAFSGEHAEKSGAAQNAYNRIATGSAAAVEVVRRRVGTAHAGAGAARPVVAELLAAHGPDALLQGAARCLEPAARALFRHVVTECDRVGHAVAALRAGAMAQFGALMDASHASLRDDLGVSTAALDRLTEVMRAAGAAGARLTGAGLGGCVVGLCAGHAAAHVIAALDTEFYSSISPSTAHSDADALRFVARAGAGAAVTSL